MAPKVAISHRSGRPLSRAPLETSLLTLWAKSDRRPPKVGRRHQIRRPHSSLLTRRAKSDQKWPKVHFWHRPPSSNGEYFRRFGGRIPRTPSNRSPRGSLHWPAGAGQAVPGVPEDPWDRSQGPSRPLGPRAPLAPWTWILSNGRPGSPWPGPGDRARTTVLPRTAAPIRRCSARRPLAAGAVRAQGSAAPCAAEQPLAG